ncbi:MAG TPA: PilN domain-containing protein [Candidatus Krumholzibacteria bacterium]|nr:PilN domain-containing protein [Candidatus Krumholzibacteria bacterium]
MIRINLLPRDEQPKQRGVVLPKVGNFAPLALVLAAALAVGSAHVYQGQRIAKLNATIAEEEAESRRLAPEIAKIKRLNQQRQDLNDRLDVITRLDTDRYFRVHLLDELNRSLPGYTWLTRFEDTGGDSYAVEGVTFSNFLVSDFLQNVSDSPYFAGIELLITEKGEINDVQVVKFKARAHAVRKAPASDAFTG